MDIKTILTRGRMQCASDIHLCVGMRPALRIDGSVCFMDHAVLTLDALQAVIDDLLDTEQKQKLHDASSLDTVFSFSDLGRFRVNIFYHHQEQQLVVPI